MTTSACTQVPVGPWVFAYRGSLHISVSLLPPRVLIQFPSSSGPWFPGVSFSHKDKEPGCIHSLAVVRPVPRSPSTFPRRLRQDDRLLPRSSRSFFPGRLYHNPIVEIGGAYHYNIVVIIVNLSVIKEADRIGKPRADNL